MDNKDETAYTTKYLSNVTDLGDALTETYKVAATISESIQFGKTSHYNQYTGFEVIDVCEQLRAPDGSGGFNRGNAFKYLARAGWKGEDTHVQDLEKALNYIEREIERVRGGVSDSIAEMIAKAGTPNALRIPVDAKYWPRCTDCGVLLLFDPAQEGRFYCENQHGDIFYSSNTQAHAVWQMAKLNYVPEESDVRRCPECDLQLEPMPENLHEYRCVKNHGYLSLTVGPDKDLWKSNSLAPPATKHPKCPDCLNELKQNPVDSLQYFCENGHGRMRFLGPARAPR